MAPTRSTYLVSVREHDGPAIVEEVRTGRKARLRSLQEAGRQIERWLREAGSSAPDRTEGRG